MMKVVRCVVIFTIKDDSDKDEFLKVASDAIKSTLQEPGCMQYDLYEGEKEFIFVEEFDCDKAFKYHCDQPYVKDLLACPAIKDINIKMVEKVDLT